MAAVERGVEGVAEASGSTEANGEPTTRKEVSWKTKYLTLKAKCEQMDQSNDVLYSKSRQIYKMIQRAEAEKKMLMRRLEQYEVDPQVDSHVTTSSSLLRSRVSGSFSPPASFPLSTTLPRSIFTSPTPDPSETEFVQNLKQDIAAGPSPSPTPHPPPSSQQQQQQTQPPPSKRPRLSTPTPSTTTSSTTKSKRTPKGAAKSSPASRRKKDQDSGAPKKPSNAFFWFCQEQRGSLEEQFRGEGVAGQHSLTKILAQKWGETTTDDRKKYYLKYTEDKKRYEREMQAYHQKKHEQQMLQEQQQQQQQQLTSSSHSPGT